MLTQSESNAERLPWWRWLLLPIVLPGILIGAVAVFVILAVTFPIFFVKGWRMKRRVSHRLKVDGREIGWHDALNRHASGGHQFLLEFGKKDRLIWLVPVPASELESFCCLPTYHQFELDARSAIEGLYRVEESASEQLMPLMQNAIRVVNSNAYLSDATVRFRDSMRIITIWQTESPSALVYKLVA